MSGPAEPVRFVIRRAQAGQRLDRVLAVELGSVSRAALRKLFARGAVQVVDAAGRPRRATKGDVATEGAELVVDLDGLEEPATEVIAEPDPTVTLQIALERADLVIVDKPAGQPTAPLRPAEAGTVVGGLLARYPEMAGHGHRPAEPGICHRLDNDTSGLLLAARTAAAFARLTAALKTGHIQKRYLLVCSEHDLPDSGVVDYPIASHPRDPKRVLACVHPRDLARHRCRPAVTRFKVLRRQGDNALVEARAPKAVRHQIRVHLAAIGFPIHGDGRYGSTAARKLGRHALHASAISWTGDDVVDAFRVRSALPPQLRALLG